MPYFCCYRNIRNKIMPTQDTSKQTVTPYIPAFVCLGDRRAVEIADKCVLAADNRRASSVVFCSLPWSVSKAYSSASYTFATTGSFVSTFWFSTSSITHPTVFFFPGVLFSLLGFQNIYTVVLNSSFSSKSASVFSPGSIFSLDTFGPVS